MSTQKRFITEEQARAILMNAPVGVLSTVSPDGRPYGVPVHYCYAQEENCVFFHCAKTGRKIDNILFSPQVSLLAVGPFKVVPEKTTTRYESTIIAGRAQIVTDPQEKAEKLRALCVKYAPGTPFAAEDAPPMPCGDSHIIKILIESITGKRSPGL